MSSANEKSEVGPNAAPVKPVKPPKPSRLVSPSSAPAASSSEETSGSTPPTSNHLSDTHNEKAGEANTKQNEGTSAVKPNIPPRGGLDATRSTSSSSEAITIPAKSSDSSHPTSETPVKLDTPALEQSSSSSRSSIPPVAFITLPGTPGHESEDGLSSPLHSPPAQVQPEINLNPSSSPSGTSGPSTPTSGGASKPRPTAAPAKDGRALPARPNTLRRENRAATISTPSTHAHMVQPTESTSLAIQAPIPLESEAKPSSESKEVAVESPRTFSVVLSIDPVTGLPSPRKTPLSDDEVDEFDTSSPFGIDGMSEDATKPIPPRKMAAKVPLPPSAAKVHPETRQQRSLSVALPSDGKRHIPLPPQTTPAKVAPLVVPVIPGVPVDHDVEKDEKDAEKRAKKEKKGLEKQDKRELQRGASTSSMTLSSSSPASPQTSQKPKDPSKGLPTPIHEESETTPSASSSSAPNDINDKLSSSSSTSSVPSATEGEKKASPSIPSDVAKASESSANTTVKLTDKDKKEKEKDDKKEKDEKKEKDKEHSKGLFSKFTDKLKGKKHNKGEEESAKSVSVAATTTSSVMEDSEEAIDPLLANEALTPSVTPREGVIGDNAMPVIEEIGVEGTKTTDDPEEGVDGDINAEPTKPSSASSTGDVGDLELHKLVLISQIKSMEELHSRLKTTIAEEQQSLADGRKSARDRSRSIGSSPSTSPTITHGKGKMADASTSTNATLKPGDRSVSPANNRKAFTAHRFAAISGFTLKDTADDSSDSLFGFKQKLADTTHGSIYACRHFQSGKMVSVRIIKPAEDELKPLSLKLEPIKQLENEQLSRILAIQRFGAELWIVSEYCPIGSLKTLLNSQFMKLDEAAIRSIARACLSGLDFLHSVQLVHGSISLSNILIDSIGNVKLCDYMLKEILESTEKSESAPSSCSTPDMVHRDIKALALTLIESIQGPLPEGTIFDASWQLNDATSVSPDFNAFLTTCLTDEMATTGQLLQHPFVVAAQSNQVLIDAIADTLTKIRAKDGGETSSQFPTRTRQELDDSFLTTINSASSKASDLLGLPPSSASPHISRSATPAPSSHSPPSSPSPNLSERLNQIKSKLELATAEILKDAPAETQELVKQLRDSFSKIAEEALHD